MKMTAGILELEEMFQSTDKDVKRESAPPKLALLTPAKVSDSVDWKLIKWPSEVEEWVRSSSVRLAGFDFETKGTEPQHFPEDRVVGIGLSTDTSAIYLPIPQDRQAFVVEVFNILIDEGVELLAHNLFFEAQWTLKYLGWDAYQQVKWHRCTYLTYKTLASEGWFGQSWGLKNAQKELLGWKQTNEVELDKWLVSNGWVKGSVSKAFKEEMTPDERYRHYLSKDNLNKKRQKKIKPDKAEMWRAPSEVLGHYCCLDSYSTYQLYAKVLKPVEQKFRVLPTYLRKFNHLLNLLARQKVRGISVDKEKMATVLEDYDRQCAAELRKFLEHPEVVEHVQSWKAAKFEETYLKKEPPRLKKNGEISKNWLNWKARRKVAEAKADFNPNSGDQLQWLFYDRLGYAVEKETKAGNPATDKQTLMMFGEAGLQLVKYNILEKQRQYVQSAYDVTTSRQVLHPSFRVPGTLTNRLSGSGGFNLQQQPKAESYLSCFKARKGFKWVQRDLTSLEKVVLAERSKDPALWSLYGPGAKPNDVYLFDGAHLPGFKDDILGAGYDPKNPTSEMISKVKSVCKSTRKKVKPASLGFGYGLGPRKYRLDMRLNGFDISDDEAFEVWKAYWKLYDGVKKWEKELLRQRRRNDGWFLNGIGRPIGVHEDKVKDIVNRDCQSTGHDLLIYWVHTFSRELDRRGIEWYPIIIDFHDESIIEVEEARAEEADYVLGWALTALNEQLKPVINLTGDGLICNNLAEVKIED